MKALISLKKRQKKFEWYADGIAVGVSCHHAKAYGFAVGVSCRHQPPFGGRLGSYPTPTAWLRLRLLPIYAYGFPTPTAFSAHTPTAFIRRRWP